MTALIAEPLQAAVTPDAGRHYLCRTHQNSRRPHHSDSRLGGFFAHSVWRLWSILKPIQTRIQDNIEIVQAESDPDRRKDALELLWRMEVKDHPPVAPVIAKANEILQAKKASGANYDREFGFFLWVVKFLEKHDRAGDSLALLTDIANYEPTDNIVTGYKYLQADAKRVSLGIKMQQLEKTLDDLRNRPFNFTVPEATPESPKPAPQP